VTDRVPQGDQAIREAVETLKVAAYRPREFEGSRFGQQFGRAQDFVPDGIWECASELPPGVDVRRWVVTETASQTGEPVVPFDPHHIGASGVVGSIGFGQDEEPCATEGVGIGWARDCTRVREVAVDNGFGGRVERQRREPLERSCVSPGGVDDEVGGYCLASIDNDPNNTPLSREGVAH
jgi:hypothetical protein